MRILTFRHVGLGSPNNSVAPVPFLLRNGTALSFGDMKGEESILLHCAEVDKGAETCKAEHSLFRASEDHGMIYFALHMCSRTVRGKTGNLV